MRDKIFIVWLVGLLAAPFIFRRLAAYDHTITAYLPMVIGLLALVIAVGIAFEKFGKRVRR